MGAEGRDLTAEEAEASDQGSRVRERTFPLLMISGWCNGWTSDFTSLNLEHHQPGPFSPPGWLKQIAPFWRSMFHAPREHRDVYCI